MDRPDPCFYLDKCYGPWTTHESTKSENWITIFTDKFSSGGYYETEYKREVQEIGDTLINAVTEAETAISEVDSIKDAFLALLNGITEKFETID